MVFQEAFGVNAHIRDVTDRFARQGYAAIAPEVYHRTAAAGAEIPYSDFLSARPHMQALTPEGMQADIRATHGFLASQTKDSIAAVGYCLGGGLAYLASTTVPLKAAISYYGGRIAEYIDRASQVSSPILFFWGGRDSHISPEIRQTIERGMQASKYPSIQTTFSDAEHAFFCDARASYNPKAAKISWEWTLTFLDQNLGNPQ
jgi:carboxymethylenebutenolidase